MDCDSTFPWFQFGFALSFGLLMYDEFEKKENKNFNQEKNELQHTVKVKRKAQKEARFVYIIYHNETRLWQGGISLFTDFSVFVKTKLSAKF